MDPIERLEKAQELMKAFQDLEIKENEFEVLCLFVNSLFPTHTLKPV